MTNYNVLIRTWMGSEKKFKTFCRTRSIFDARAIFNGMKRRDPKVTQGLKFKPWTLILSYQNQIKVKQLTSGDQLISSPGGQKFSNKKKCSKFSLLSYTSSPDYTFISHTITYSCHWVVAWSYFKVVGVCCIENQRTCY